MNIKKFLMAVASVVCVLTVTPTAMAAGGGIAWDKAPDRSTNLSALQNGAKLFANYCLNCHSATFMRYTKLQDIGLTKEQISKDLLFTHDKMGANTMRAAILPAEATEWFGANPPDLTLAARSRSGPQGSGSDYLYTYLRTYYRDSSKATGWNNLAFPSVGMPHVLWELQGERKPLFETVEAHGHKEQRFVGWEQVTEGSMTPTEFDSNMADLVGFMTWMAEPERNTRYRLGVWVLLFLGLFTLIAWRLNAAYWKDIK